MKTLMMMKAFLLAGLVACTTLACSSADRAPQDGIEKTASASEEVSSGQYMERESLRQLHAAFASGELDHLTLADVEVAIAKAKTKAPHLAPQIDAMSASALLTQIETLRGRAHAESADSFIIGVRGEIARAHTTETTSGFAQGSPHPQSWALAGFVFGVALGAAIVGCASSDACILWMCNNVYC